MKLPEKGYSVVGGFPPILITILSTMICIIIMLTSLTDFSFRYTLTTSCMYRRVLNAVLMKPYSGANLSTLRKILHLVDRQHEYVIQHAKAFQ